MKYKDKYYQNLWQIFQYCRQYFKTDVNPNTQIYIDETMRRKNKILAANAVKDRGFTHMLEDGATIY